MDTTPLDRIEKLEDITAEKKKTIASKRKELEDLELKKKKKLEDLEAKKERELESYESDKKKELEELEQKKKELAELEKKKLQEIEETQEWIDKSFQDFVRHKRQLMAEEENRTKKDIDLEEIAKESPAQIKQIAPNEEMINQYFSSLKTPKTLYSITNSTFYNNLNELKERASRGEITPKEEAFIDGLRNQFERFSKNANLRENDQASYVARSLNVINDIVGIRQYDSGPSRAYESSRAEPARDLINTNRGPSDSYRPSPSPALSNSPTKTSRNR